MNRRTFTTGLAATAITMILPAQATTLAADKEEPNRQANRSFEDGSGNLLEVGVFRYANEDDAAEFFDWFSQEGMTFMADSIMLDTGMEFNYAEDTSFKIGDESKLYAGGVFLYEVAVAVVRTERVVHLWIMVGGDPRDFMTIVMPDMVERYDDADINVDTDAGLLGLLLSPVPMAENGWTMTEEYVGEVPSDNLIFN